MPSKPNSPISTTRDGAVAVIRIAHPPVNALSHTVRTGLLAAIAAAQVDTAVKAIVLVSEGSNFSAGADIREFGQAPQPPSLSDLCTRIENCPKPVVAALHGAALGGGLEVALAAHYRVALPSAKLGLPEVQLGLLPGAGGTVRTPRLIGAKAALDLILTGRHVKAKNALALGLVDRVAEDSDARAAGLSYAQALLAQGAGARATRDAQGLADRDAAQAAIAAAQAQVEKTARGLFAPFKIVQAVQDALDHPFTEALQLERQAFLACLQSPQRAGLIHAFLAERASAHIPETAPPRTLASLAVVGGGTMGAGIAVAALDAGLTVTMIERDAESIARGQANVAKVYDGLIARGRMTPQAKAAVMARYTPAVDYAAARNADMVIEAVFEDIEVKKTVFQALERVCKPGAVLATNTSYLDVDAIAASTRRAQDVIGLHFFSPAHIMRLLEIVVPAKVAPDVVTTAFAFAKTLKKVPVRAGVCDGFIGNRILAVYKQAADYLMEDGASPYEIDAAVRDFGYPMGPFQVSDLAGGDIGWATRKRRAPTRDPRMRYVEIADRLCERGWFGQKTGRGFYLYPNGTRTGVPDPEVLAIVDAERAKKGITPRPFSSADILRRYLAAMVNEGAKVLADGIALRPLDIDVTFLCGYGFPRWRGGPMFWADSVGLDKILSDIRAFAQEDDVFWQPAPLLEQLVQERKTFASLNPNTSTGAPPCVKP